MRLSIDRVVVRGLAQPPDPATLRLRVADEVRAAVRPLDAGTLGREVAAVVAGAVARAAGDGRE